jgi:hypothetical protein
MVSAAVLSLFLVGCSALKTQVTKTSGPNTKLVDEVQYSYKPEDQKSNSKTYRLKEDIVKVVKEHSTGAMKEVGPIDDYLEMWYVNLLPAKDRRQCMDGQLKEMGMKSHMFKAINFHQCASKAFTDPDMVNCLIHNGYGDCAKKGLNPQAIATHGAQGNDAITRAYHIVSNACSHKRMMAQMLKQHKASKSKAKYAVLLEDDVAFDRHDFVRKVVNFAEMYDGQHNSTWSMVQIDPFGSKCDRHIVGYFEGLPVWKPKNVNGNHECSNYWGAHALLVKYDKIPEILQHMENHPTVPLDWLPAELENGLAAQLYVARNPEAMNQYYAGTVHHQWVNYPEYCKKSVKTSTIGA